ncbi:ATP-binding protein [Streptomyces aureus]|uniref:ATP-binding protein n=1 Tax=Streptomyces aureus TaxID=193461 RepID=UPI0033E63D0C
MTYNGTAPQPPDPGHLIGRGREQVQLRHMLANGGLTTVTGPAGVGKSTLAIHTLTQLRNVWQGRMTVAQWWRPGPVLSARQRLCKAAGLPDDATVEELSAALGDKPTILLVDDVDPARLVVARLVQHLLMQQPRLRVLVTSRAPLGLGEEGILALGPLEPDDGVLLYRTLLPDQQHGNDTELTDLCSTLDYNPLAIVRTAAPARPAMQERHSSTLSAEDAGAQLLDPDERTAWARLSVLPGSFNMTTAYALAARNNDGTEINVAAAVARLHQHSILHTEGTPGDPGGVREPRFQLASSPRIWGMRHLQERGEHSKATRRMELRAQTIASEARRLWHLGHQRQALDTVEEDWPLLEAIADAPGLNVLSREASLSICGDLWFWWMTRGHAATGLRLLQHHLHQSHEPSFERCESLTLAAHLALACHDESSQALLNQAWDAATDHGSHSLLASVLTAHACQAIAEQNWDQARHLLRSADLLAPASRVDWIAAPSAGQAWSRLAAALTTAEGLLAPAAYALNRAQSAIDPDHDPWAYTHLLHAQAVHHLHRGRPAAAWRACQTAQESVRHHRYTDLRSPLDVLTAALLSQSPTLHRLFPAPRFPRELTSLAEHRASSAPH